MGKYMTEAEAWREIARQWCEVRSVFELDALGTCPLVRKLCDHMVITMATRNRMFDRIKDHLGGSMYAYGSARETEELGYQEYVDKYREARCLAALWLAHEAEDDQ